MRPSPRPDGDSTLQPRFTSSSESAMNEALLLMREGELGQPAWNMDSLKTNVLFAEAGDVENVFQESSFRPKEPGFTTLINFCGRLRDWRRAEEVFRAMTSVFGIPPNTFTFSALISACSSSGEWEQALRIFAEMKEAARSNSKCRPNAVTYSALITACERGGHCEQALEMYHEMLQEGVVPDQGTFTAAVSSCLSTDRWREADRILEDMHRRGYTAPSALYGDLLVKYAQCGEWQHALNLHITVQMVGVSVDIQMCRSLMESLEKGGRADMVGDLLNVMRDGRIEIDLDTYNSALKTLASAGLFARALAVFECIANDGLEPDVDSVSALVSAYVNGGEEEIAQKLKEDYKSKGIDIDNPTKEDVDAVFLTSSSSRSSNRTE